MKSMSVTSLFKPIGRALGRYHLTLFIVLVVAGLAAAVMLLNILLTEPPNDGYTSSIGGGSIDEDTLARIKSLHTSSEGAPQFAPPTGRINPFAE